MKESENNDKPFQDIEFKSLKIVFKSILIILFIILSMILIFSIKSQAITQDIDYIFDNDYIYNSNDGFNYTNFNTRNQTIITQDNYTATYDFLDIPIDTTSIDIDFIDVDGSTGNCEAIIVDNLYGHNNILKLIDYNEGDTFFSVSNNLNDITYGTIEFWLLTSDAIKQTEIFLFNEGDVSLYLMVKNNKFQYYTTSWNDIGMNAISNHWYHIRIDFECTVGNYLGLNQYKFFIKVNGIQFGSFDFRYERNYFDAFSFQSYGVDVNYITYIDAIGYSWNIDYDIGQNIEYPISTSTSVQEIDKCEFAYNITTLEPNGFSKFNIDNNWLEYDDSTNAHVQTHYIYDSILIDYALFQEVGQEYGIYKEFNYTNDGIFNISFGLSDIELYTPELDGWYFNIYSSDDTLLVSLLLKSNTEIYLYYYDGSSYILLHELQSLQDFSFNIYINNRVILRLNDNSINYIWYFSELTTNIGIKTIEIIGGDEADIGDSASLTIDYIGFYINGSSYLPNDCYGKMIETYISEWDDNIHNIFEITANGNFTFSIYYNDIFDYTLFYNDTFVNEKKRIYEYNLDVWKGINLYTFELISDKSFLISEIKIYANVLKENSNIYYPSYNYILVNRSENYFYVENNKLYFNIDLNESSYEGIEAIFDISDISTTNGSISFSGKYSGVKPSYLIIEYLGYENSYMEMKDYSTTSKYLLPQSQMTNRLIINVSDYIPFQDNYTNHNEGYISGYISDISFNYLRDIEYTLTTMTLIAGFIPLMVIFTPTLALYSKYGKKIILPSMILMTIICFVGQLIPLWLFSISLIIYGYLIIIDKYESE